MQPEAHTAVAAADMPTGPAGDQVDHVDNPPQQRRKSSFAKVKDGIMGRVAGNHQHIDTAQDPGMMMFHQHKDDVAHDAAHDTTHDAPHDSPTGDNAPLHDARFEKAEDHLTSPSKTSNNFGRRLSAGFQRMTDSVRGHKDHKAKHAATEPESATH